MRLASDGEVQFRGRTVFGGYWNAPDATAAAFTDDGWYRTGDIGRLEVVNIGARPDIAQQFGVRTVPWVRLGPFELEGLRSPAELEAALQRRLDALSLAWITSSS